MATFVYTINMEKYKIITFKNNNVQLDVNVSPEEDTVWLTKDQISLLFGRDRSVISRHINKIYKDGELDKNTSVHFLHISPHDSNPNHRPPEYYNLDVVISVGYRVKSQNGVVFRKWANNVLKEFLLKGYAISNRAIITQENYINLVNKVISLDDEVSKLKKDISNILPNSQIFYKGQYFESSLFIEDVVIEVNTELIIIDPYFDKKSLENFKCKKGINCILITSSKNQLSNALLNSFSNEYFPIERKNSDDFHDRFLIIDNEIIYHVGTSLNYLGNKTFIITKIGDESWCKEFIKKVKEI